MLFSSNYKTLPVLVLVILFFGLAAFLNLSSGSFLWAATSPDAIAFRVMPNPDHLSPRRWYQDNIKLKGAPQGLTVDGYEAVRDGRTVYVNAANINLASDTFYSNIYIISYNQQAENETVDIFAQILAHWKFNTNIPDPGICNRTIAQSCLYSSDCPTGEYCLQKINIIRDTKRLADLNDIKEALEKYNSQHGFYPKLAAGSYLTNKTISTWPSWQASLGKELGLVLPIDPINKLGACPADYDAITCWNQTAKTFYDPSPGNGVFNLPADSHVFFYETNANGSSYSACSVMQSGLLTPQNSSSACADSAKSTSISISGQNPNHSPIINGANLNGVPNKEFIGWIGVSDPDNDTLSYSIKLIDPAPNLWERDYSWSLAAGAEKFVFRPSKVLGQIIIYAAQAGKAGIYKIEFTVDDGQGQPNSKVSQIFDLRIGPIPMTLTSPIMGEVVEIGTSKNYTLTGTDNSGNPLTELKLRSFTFDGSSISSALLGSHGFSLSGMKLFEANASAQKTGTYVINVYAEDSTTHKQIDSSLEITILNHPPVINSIIITYANGTTQTSSSFIIDNGENATVKVTATDTPGHNVKYELVDNTIGLIINRDSGEITGLSALNSQVSADRTYTGIKVKAFDQYCAASPSNPEKCSVIATFNLTVKAYCSLDVPSSTIAGSLPGPFIINDTGGPSTTGSINLGGSLGNYSEVGDGLVDVRYIGTARSSAVVFVLDLSGTMTTNVNGSSAISQLKSALISSGGVFDQLYTIGSGLTGGRFLKVGLIGFNDFSDGTNNDIPVRDGLYPYPDYSKGYYYTSNLPASYPLADIVGQCRKSPYKYGNVPPLSYILEPCLAGLKTEVNGYQAYGGTNTLAALNEAEKLLGTITGSNVDKYIVLMSDGIPAVTRKVTNSGVCYCICGNPGNCRDHTTCTGSGLCYPVTCEPSCVYTNNCGGGGGGGGGGGSGGGGSSFNNNSWLKTVFNNLFDIKAALAITAQTRCANTGACDDCPTYQTHTCNTVITRNCGLNPPDDTSDFSIDVVTQATALKNAGIKFYSIYYNTGTGSIWPLPLAGSKMCGWSSNDPAKCCQSLNGAFNCDNSTYFFSGDNISQMFRSVMNTIVNKPRGVEIANIGNIVIVTDSQTTSIDNKVSDVNLNNPVSNPVLRCVSKQQCGQVNLSVSFTGSGSLEFSNLRFKYCPTKLH